MKTTFIIPKDDGEVTLLNQTAFGRIFPPSGLARMAGIAGRYGSVALVDERMSSVRHSCNTDAAIFFINSYNRQRCLSLAELYGQSGSHVVLTGPVAAIQLSDYAHTILLGFGEDCLAEFLSDYKQGGAQCFYGDTGKQKSQTLLQARETYAVLSPA
jgi:hypothetical protein